MDYRHRLGSFGNSFTALGSSIPGETVIACYFLPAELLSFFMPTELLSIFTLLSLPTSILSYFILEADCLCLCRRRLFNSSFSHAQVFGTILDRVFTLPSAILKVVLVIFAERDGPCLG